MVTLRGITWGHSRGFTSVVSTAQRYGELHPQVDIQWEKRSLQAFADGSLDALASEYDLLVIDHPWAGFVAQKSILLPLQNHLPADYLADQAAHSVGGSHESYEFNGFQTALAIDAAAPVAVYRPDHLATGRFELPATWEDLLALARQGRVIYAGIPINLLMDFLMLCATQGNTWFDGEKITDNHTAINALEALRELAGHCPRQLFDWDPIEVHELLSSQDTWSYCPYAYGYSNYSRLGYARSILKATDVVSYQGNPLQTVLGGTGLAISAHCRHLDTALDYARFTASPDIQKTLFFDSGGQPGHRGAWLDAEVNRRSLDFFKDTLATLDRSAKRPRYSGFLTFQDRAGDLVRDWVMDGGDSSATLKKLNHLYQTSQQGLE
ncbi:extracellular solute-binding protein [Biostraticola tofi]|uniref:Carbohydrate ABC transporter substrate-binding protein (CUT1 family) n=1 Tax=Biostraticola tofi TaxID=466109 RepID=A0A4R3YPH6_9GAMM|nr:extracellular solute-binding protein [Biostraticola tofi]TCV94280.1 carbohydrate ABC transporter substrate-binding protein (CUT1 family) [Biostraticola tofi]